MNRADLNTYASFLAGVLLTSCVFMAVGMLR